MGWFAFRPYVSVAQRRANATKLTAKLQKEGKKITPVKIEGRMIATTFWGKAWCEHLESYSDFSNRLPRGRTYVRNGSVIDLQITPGTITALVSGSEVYRITVKIEKLNPQRWKSVRSQCGGQIGSLVELLQGRFSKSVMEIMTHRDKGLFPAPAEISMKCSCPDWAGMCKHLAAVLYGIGARFDHEPELLFTLRQVDHLELLDQVAAAGSLASIAVDGQKTLAENELADVFGIDLETTPVSVPATDSSMTASEGSKRTSSRTRPATKTTHAAKKAPKTKIAKMKTKSAKVIKKNDKKVTVAVLPRTSRQAKTVASKSTSSASKKGKILTKPGSRKKVPR